MTEEYEFRQILAVWTFHMKMILSNCNVKLIFYT